MRTNVDAVRGLEDPRQVEFTLDGARVFLTSIGGTSPGIPGGDDPGKPKLSRSDAADAQLRTRVTVKAGAAASVSFKR